MEEIVTRIKGYVMTVFPTILTELGITTEYLTYMVNNVVDRALVAMNRDQLVEQYEQDLIDFTDEEDDFWDGYVSYPIPPRLERALADSVVSTIKSVQNNNTGTTGAVKTIKDNGQEISYADLMTNFFNSSDDSEIFSGIKVLLRRYTLPTVVRNRNYDNTRQLYNENL